MEFRSRHNVSTGAYLAGPRHAQTQLGTHFRNGGGTPPRQSFAYFVNVIPNYGILNLDISEHFKLSNLIKTFQFPQITYRNQVLNQYNRKRISQTGLEYGNLALTVHDDIHDNWMRFLSIYHNYHYMDGRGYSDELNGFKQDLDTTLPMADQNASNNGLWNPGSAGLDIHRDKYLIDRIDFYKYSGGKVSVTHFINPTLNSFTQSANDYSSSELQELQLDFSFEKVLISPEFEVQMDEFEKERFAPIFDPVGNLLFRQVGGLEGGIGGLVEDFIDGVTNGINDFIKGILFGNNENTPGVGAIKGLNNESQKKVASASRTSQQLQPNKGLVNPDVTSVEPGDFEGRSFFERLYDSTIGAAILSAGQIANDRLESEFAEATAKSSNEIKDKLFGG
jgi:hypothetical protein